MYLARQLTKLVTVPMTAEAAKAHIPAPANASTDSSITVTIRRK
jgi:hypothetical protein